MSNETDRLVSDAYDELANERTPEALNREILRLAAKEGRTRYSIARAWMRPAAWAATIGLSLVVVLELSNMPDSEMTPLPQSVPIDTAVPEVPDQRRDSINEETILDSEAREERQDALAKRSRPYSPQEQTAEKALMLNDAPVVSEDAARDAIAAQSRDLRGALEENDQDDLQETMQRARQQAAQPVRVPTDRKQAAELVTEESADVASAARAQVATEQPTAAALRAESFAAGTTSLRAESDYLCPAKERLSAEKWLKCIREFEASSPRELVEREYEEFRKSYPEFEQPAADR